MNLNDFLNTKNIYGIEGNISFSEEKVKDLIKLINKPNIKILEIGFNAGHSADLFLKNTSSIVYSFDIGTHDYIIHAKEYIDNKYPNRHTLILGDSRITIPKFIDQKLGLLFDIIFVDGGHDYDVAYSDLENCYFLSHMNTIIICDDVLYNKDWIQHYNVGPTNAWLTQIEENKIYEIGNKDYSSGMGMAWGYYVF